MARLKDIDETVAHYLETLLAYYTKTDPANGVDDHLSKHARAQHAIEVFWYLQGKLMSWAQAHMTGYAILSETPGLAEFLKEHLGEEIDLDSHVLEQIGLLYNLNPPDDDDPDLLRIQELFEKFCELNEIPDDQPLLGPQAMRRFIFELLMSRCADNSYWRMPLQESFRALNEGETDPLISPPKGRRQGMPHSLNQWKLEALRQVRFRVGAGMKKYRALEEVGDAIGQSPETLRAWEKALLQSVDYANDLYCSELAGQFKGSLDDKPMQEIEKMADYGWHRGLHNLGHARYLYRQISEVTLDEIRERIRHYRQKEEGG